MMSKSFNASCLWVAALATGCTSTSLPPSGGPVAMAPGLAGSAIAQLMTPAGARAGSATLTPKEGGVEIELLVEGLTPGLHGFHVHSNGACAPGPDADVGRVIDFGAAGGHFDPGATRNHGAPGQSIHDAHAGELPNLEVAANGRGSAKVLNRNVTIAPGPQSIMGRTLVVHADQDDYVTDPSGNSGGRVLCGVVQPPAGIVTGRSTLEGTHTFPEGIALDPITGDAFVGSTSTGDIFRIPKGASKGELLQSGGSPGRQGAFGMKLDASRRLWIAGGPQGTLAVIDTRTAATVSVMKVTPGPQSFVNDLVVAPDGFVYATDSYRPVLYRARLVEGVADSVLTPWVDLSNTAIRYVPNEINLNGIVVSEDGRRLIAIQLITGQLWRIDVQTGSVAELRVQGGELKNGDGLVLTSPTELVVIRNEQNELVRVRLDAEWTAGNIEGRYSDARLRYPTTAAVVPGGLMVVNAQLNKQKSPPPLLPFDVVSVRFPPQGQ